MARNPHHRITRLTATVAAAFTILIGFSAPATAGGWAVGSLDAIPQSTAGETVEVGFTMLQHGVTPADLADDVGIEIVGTDGTINYFAAEQGETIGHYNASATFPSTAGEYEWNIRMNAMPQLRITSDEMNALIDYLLQHENPLETKADLGGSEDRIVPLLGRPPARKSCVREPVFGGTHRRSAGRA